MRFSPCSRLVRQTRAAAVGAEQRGDASTSFVIWALMPEISSRVSMLSHDNIRARRDLHANTPKKKKTIHYSNCWNWPKFKCPICMYSDAVTHTKYQKMKICD